MAKDSSFLGTGWAFPPSFDPHKGTANMVNDEEDIRQSLFILLSTTPYERETKPEYGCDLRRILFEPINQATLQLAKEIIEIAVLYFEPRITLENVEIDIEDEMEGIIYIHLHYTIRKINVRTNIVYPFYKLEGTNIVNV